jgi:D-alanyl-lipoteichoic acid acyltransferase DltB (MBOAT superfamily)
VNFNTLEYLVFLPVVAVLHVFAPHKWRWALLLAASWLFYFSWEPMAGLLLVLTTLVSWLCALGVGKTQGKASKKALTAASIVFSLGLLIFFKYSGFLAPSLSLKILLPVGISFYTFQSLSYVIDVYRGKIEPERHFGYYALFVSFFPQLVAGPIERPDKLIPQLRAERKITRSDILDGGALLLRGYFKKTVLADTIAPCVDSVFALPETASAIGVLLGAALFGLQIYCDFSGYTDIARGSARLLGVELTENFDRPYSAASVREFWRRWHISLTSWFTDYVYIPLGGNRKGRARQIVNTLIVFLLSGLWHGAGWGFVIWGLIHGALISLEILTDRKAGKVCTFALVSLAWIFFRAPSISDALTLFSRLISGWESFALPTGIAGALCAAAALFALDRNSKPSPIATFAMALTLGLSALALLGSGGGNAFIYFQF